MPMLPGRSQPQPAYAALSLGYDRYGVGGHRASVAGPGLAGRAWRAPGRALPPRCRRRDPLLVKEGITWRAMLIDFPPWQSAYYYYAGWQSTGATAQMHDGLRDQVRIAAGPTADTPESSSSGPPARCA